MLRRLTARAAEAIQERGRLTAAPRSSAPLAAATGALALATGACAAAGDPGGDTSLEVVAAIYPLAFVAERVGGERVSVTGLAPPGVEPHDLELSPSQVADLARADLVVYLGGFQPAVEEAVAAHASGVAVDATGLVPLRQAAQDDGHENEAEAEAEAEDEAEQGDEAEGQDEDGHADHGDQDLHVWLDPDRLATIADELAQRFGGQDQEHAAAYTANAEALGEELAELDAAYTDGLAECERREFVVSHAAFGYLAERYDLAQVAISGLSPEEEPSPQRLAEVIEEAREHSATTIFFEVLVSPEVAQVIADEVGADTAVLDPIEGLAPDSDADYLSLMRDNLDALRAALGCT